LAFKANGQHIQIVHQDLEIAFPSYVTKDVSIVVESLVKNKWKGNALKHFHSFCAYFC
jgi:hypothetical protein